MLKFDKKDKVLIICSSPLDPDSLGSGLILKKTHENLCREIDVCFPRNLRTVEREKYAEYPYFDEILFQDSEELMKTGGYSVVILVDGRDARQFFNYEEDRDGKLDFPEDARIIRIDHHPLAEEELAQELIHEKCSSTIEVLLSQVIDVNDLDDTLGELAYIGIITDTGNFNWNFTAHTLRIAADLVDLYGIKYEELVEKYVTGRTYQDLKIGAQILEMMEVDEDLKTAFLIINRDVLKSLDIEIDAVKNYRNIFFNDIGKKLPQYDRIIFMWEDKGVVRLGGRGNSGNKISIPDLFRNLGGNGGGHFNAAGMDVNGNFDEVLEKLQKEIRKLI